MYGAEDAETPIVHSRRVYAALAGPKRLEEISGAGHNDALVKGWNRVQSWITNRVEGRSRSPATLPEDG